jgi:hypothetical protein
MMRCDSTDGDKFVLLMLFGFVWVTVWALAYILVIYFY